MLYRNFEQHVVTYSNWLIKFRYLVIFISLLFALGCISGIQYIGISTDYRAFFSKENPQLVAFEALQDTFSKSDNILFVISPKNENVFTRQTLTAIETITNSAWEIPFATRVDSLTNFQHTFAQGDEFIIQDLLANVKTRNQDEIDKIHQIAVTEPLLLNRLISPDGKITAVNVTILLPGKTRKEVPKAVAFARDIAEQVRHTFPGLEVHLTGNIMMNNAMSESSVSDIKSLLPIMYAIIFFTVWVLLRSLASVLSILVVVGLSTMTAVGLAGWLGIVITPPSASAPTIIMTLALAGSVHVFISLLLLMRSGISKSEAIGESLRINMEPIFLTSITTMIGFFSMNFADAPPLRDLGNMAAIGIMSAFFYTVFLLPVLVLILPTKVEIKTARSTMIMEKLGDFVVGNYRFILVAVSLFILVMVSFVPRLELNDQYVNYFDKTTAFRVDTDYTMEKLTGIYKIEFPLSSGESGGISAPEYLRHVENFSNWYKQQPEVVHVSSIVEIMKKLNMNMHGDDISHYVLPESRELAAQYLLMYEMSLPYGLDLNNQVSVDKDKIRFTTIVKNITTKELLDLEARSRKWLEQNAPKSMQVEGTGSSMIFAHMSIRNILSMISGTLLAMVFITLVIMLALRSVNYGLLSLISNMLPAVIAMGIWALTVGQMGFALSVMIAMTLGIVVDDSIHFLSKYIRARDENNLEPKAAVQYVFTSVGYALITTTIVLVFGFMVLAQSSFLPNSGMAMLTMITISIALLLDLLLLPALLIWLESNWKIFSRERVKVDVTT